MHNAAFRHLGLDYVYVPFSVQPEQLAQAVEGVRGLELAGVNVTIPHKSTVMAYLDEVSPEARLIGAVNTIVNRNGRLHGYNTDAPGFIKSLETDAKISPAGKRILIMGAGGASRAVAVQITLNGAAEIVFTSPVPGEIPSIKQAVRESGGADPGEVEWNQEAIGRRLQETDILINATPLGMYPNNGEMPPVKVDEIMPGTLVCDLIYNPRETVLLRQARESGLQTLNGMGMLLYQGAIAFEKWTGAEPPVEVMRCALETALQKQAGD